MRRLEGSLMTIQGFYQGCGGEGTRSNIFFIVTIVTWREDFLYAATDE